MSDATPVPLPPYFEVPHDGDPVPPEVMLGGPRIRCTLDGDRLWSIEDAQLHADHFHAKTDGAAGLPSVDEGYLRNEALSQAVRAARPGALASEIRERAESFIGFLRGDAPAEPEHGPSGRPRRIDDAPEGAHEALDRIWQTIREDEGGYGLRALEGDSADEDVLEVLRTLPDEVLRRVGFASHVLHVLAEAERGKRR